MKQICTKWFKFKQNVLHNNLKLKQRATDWSIYYMISNFQTAKEYSAIVKYAKIAAVVIQAAMNANALLQNEIEEQYLTTNFDKYRDDKDYYDVDDTN